MNNDDRKPVRKMGDLFLEEERRLLAAARAAMKEEKAAWEKVQDLFNRIRGKQ
jgi:hypothetical protein